MTDQIGLFAFKLTQKRYSAGAFYLSLIIHRGRPTGIDSRFHIEDGNQLTPTKNGFRTPIENLEELKKALTGDLRALDDTVLFENRSFQFHLRYLNDKYGEAIDFRKYKTTAKYTGWYRGGIRMKIEDVVTMRDCLARLDPQAIDSADNIFAGKVIVQKEDDKAGYSGGKEPKMSPEINKLLDFSLE